MKRWIVIALFAAACGGKKDEGKDTSGGGGGGEPTAKPAEGELPADVSSWMPKNAADAWNGTWSTRLMWGGKKGSVSMAGNPVALQITGTKVKAFDGSKEGDLTLAFESPCSVDFEEAISGGKQMYSKNFIIRDGALQIGDGAVGYRKGKTGLVCGSTEVFVLAETGCKEWKKKFGREWEGKDKPCKWTTVDGKDVVTIGDGDWATKVVADGDFFVSDSFKETLKYTTKTASYDDAKQEVTAKVEEKDPGAQAKKAGGEVGKTDSVLNLAATFGADKASVDGKQVEITAQFFSNSTMTVNGKKSYTVSLVDSKDTSRITLSCSLKDEPPADLKQYDKVTAKGTVKESFGTAGLEDCTLAKAK